jgi:rRNA-processing protein FCF1
MSQNNKDPFFADRVYPDAQSIFSWHPKSLAEIKSECLIVLDTNILLAPYTVSQKSLSAIADSYEAIIDENRMIVPAQVAREFARLHANKLTELHGALANLKSKDLNIDLKSYPLLQDVPAYVELRDVVAQITNMAQEFKRSIGKLQGVIEGWEWKDPVSQAYKRLFEANVVVDPELDHESIEKDLAWRNHNEIPPGYKDSGKVGDLLIWHTILKVGAERKKDLIFVTGDLKADWWHRSNNKNLYPRHELVEEYRRKSEGASFHMLTFPNFLTLYDVNEQVVEEVRSAIPSYVRTNAVTISDGQLLIVRHNGRYGAVQPIKQVMTRDAGKEYIHYHSWFLPDGSWKFDQLGTVETFTGTARLPQVGESIEESQLRIGPIRLEWSGDSTGMGYVYFGPSSTPSPEYELTVLNESDITQIDASQLQFYRPE